MTTAQVVERFDPFEDRVSCVIVIDEVAAVEVTLNKKIADKAK